MDEGDEKEDRFDRFDRFYECFIRLDLRRRKAIIYLSNKGLKVVSKQLKF